MCGSGLSCSCVQDVSVSHRGVLSGSRVGPKNSGIGYGEHGLFRGGVRPYHVRGGALEHERPFLGPLYKLISIHPRDSTRKIPPYVKFILSYLSNEITKQRHYQCSTRLTTADCIPRVDAQASTHRTGIGGCFSVTDNERNLDPWMSSWFSLEIKKDDFSWIFEKGDCPSLAISTLDALAILVSLKMRFGEQKGPRYSFEH